MVERHRPFWPSLYSRLVPHVYLEGASPETIAATLTHEDYLTNVETLAGHIRADLVLLMNTANMESRLARSHPPVIGLSSRSGQQEDGTLTVQDQHRVDRKALPLSDLPRLQASVLNYGVPSSIGAVAHAINETDLGNEIKKAITTFEPRVRNVSVQVKFDHDFHKPKEDGSVDLPNDGKSRPWEPLKFTIYAEIDAKPTPMSLRIRSVWDLEQRRTDAVINDVVVAQC